MVHRVQIKKYRKGVQKVFLPRMKMFIQGVKNAMLGDRYFYSCPDCADFVFLEPKILHKC